MRQAENGGTRVKKKKGERTTEGLLLSLPMLCSYVTLLFSGPILFNNREQILLRFFTTFLVIVTGFVKRLVHDIWTVFEGGQDRKPARPRIKHVDSIDSRTYNKVIIKWLSL